MEIKCLHDFEHTPSASDELKFERIFTRYIFKEEKWKKYVRRNEGFWESDEGFPDRKLFP